MTSNAGGQLLGRIIGCRGHTRYFFTPVDEGTGSSGMARKRNSPGTFVTISGCDDSTERGETLIGIIISNSLLSMDGFRAGGGGPMSGEDIGLFTPEVMSEASLITEVRGIGSLNTLGEAVFGVPEYAPGYLNEVREIPEELISSIHTKEGDLHLEYYPLLSEGADGQMRFALKRAMGRLVEIIPEKKMILSLLRAEIERPD